jgi:hypothetical protein
LRFDASIWTLTACIRWVEEPDLTKALISFIEDHEACRTALGMSKGDSPNAGKHNEKTQIAWFEDIAGVVLKPDVRWAPFKVKRLGPIIRNRVGK